MAWNRHRFQTYDNFSEKSESLQLQPKLRNSRFSEKILASRPNLMLNFQRKSLNFDIGLLSIVARPHFLIPTPVKKVWSRSGDQMAETREEVLFSSYESGRSGRLRPDLVLRQRRVYSFLTKRRAATAVAIGAAKSGKCRFKQTPGAKAVKPSTTPNLARRFLGRQGRLFWRGVDKK